MRPVPWEPRRQGLTGCYRDHDKVSVEGFYFWAPDASPWSALDLPDPPAHPPETSPASAPALARGVPHRQLRGAPTLSKAPLCARCSPKRASKSLFPSPPCRGDPGRATAHGTQPTTRAPAPNRPAAHVQQRQQLSKAVRPGGGRLTNPGHEGRASESPQCEGGERVHGEPGRCRGHDQQTSLPRRTRSCW